MKNFKDLILIAFLAFPLQCLAHGLSGPEFIIVLGLLLSPLWIGIPLLAYSIYRYKKGKAYKETLGVAFLILFIGGVFLYDDVFNSNYENLPPLPKNEHNKALQPTSGK